MKKADLPSVLLHALLASLVSIFSILCVTTTYDFTWDPGHTIGLCLFFSCAASALCYVPKGKWALLALVLLSGRQLWIAGLAQHTEAVLWYVSVLLEKAYDTGFVIWWTGNSHLHRDTTAFFMALGSLGAVATAMGLSKNRPWGGILTGMISLVPSLLFTDMSPTPVCLLGLLLGLFTLFLSRLIRRCDPVRATRFTLRTLISSLVALAIVVACFPPGNYKAPDFSKFEQWIDDLRQLLPTDPDLPPDSPPGTIPGGNGGGSSLTDKVALDRVTSKTFSYRFAFDITTSESGYIYLREGSYAAYSGKAWYTDSSRSTMIPEDFLLGQPQRVSLDTYKSLKHRLTPYYLDKLSLDAGKLENPDDQITYSFDYRPLVPDWQAKWLELYGDSSVSSFAWDGNDVYLTLPETTRAGLVPILEELQLDGSMNVLDTANTIAAYIKSSASYSLRSGKMPGNEEDFALWFLEDADVGYCVHFATAATVLLRSAGIPARYVTGYMVRTTAGMERVVYEGNAHAWVEYWLPGFGWTVLEVTPGSTEPLPTEPTEPTTQPPQPSTEPSTVPTEPSVMPTEPSTAPSVPSVKPTTVPLDTTPGDPGNRPEPPAWLLKTLKILLWLAAVCLTLLLQWRLRLTLRLRRHQTGSTNAQALKRWRHICLLAKLRKAKPPTQLRELANKAKFSQYSLDHRELRRFDLYRAETIDLLRRKNLLLQIYYRLILALY